MLPNVLNTVNLPNHTDSYTYRDFNDIDDMTYDIEAINNGIINLLLTKRGSLPAKPTFGSDIHLIPFSQLDYVTKNTFRLSIISSIKNWETRIHVSKVIVDSSDEYNQILANISYTFTDSTVSVDGEVSLLLGDL